MTDIQKKAVSMAKKYNPIKKVVKKCTAQIPFGGGAICRKIIEIQDGRTICQSCREYSEILEETVQQGLL